MSPYLFEYQGVGEYARLFYVYGSSNPGTLDVHYASLKYGVRPVISLSNEKFIVKTIVE